MNESGLYESAANQNDDLYVGDNSSLGRPFFTSPVVTISEGLYADEETFESVIRRLRLNDPTLVSIALRPEFNLGDEERKEFERWLEFNTTVLSCTGINSEKITRALKRNNDCASYMNVAPVQYPGAPPRPRSAIAVRQQRIAEHTPAPRAQRQNTWSTFFRNQLATVINGYIEANSRRNKQLATAANEVLENFIVMLYLITAPRSEHNHSLSQWLFSRLTEHAGNQQTQNSSQPSNSRPK